MVELDNLIDLSFDDNDNCLAVGKSNTTHMTECTKKILDEQKQDDPCDPFEIAEKAVCANETATNMCEQIIKVGNLLGFEEDNLIDVDEDRRINNKLDEFNCKNNNNMCTSVTFDNYMDETRFDSPQLGNDSKDQQKSMRKYTKSTFQTPDSRASAKDTHTHVGSGERSTTDIFAKESPQMIASESPLKFADDDFDADLEMLNIPMLQTLCAKTTAAKHTDYRTQLLKLSLANATSQTPESPCQTDVEQAQHLAKINDDQQTLEKAAPIVEKNYKDLQVFNTSPPSFNDQQTPDDSPDSVPMINASAPETLLTKTTPLSHLEGVTTKFQSYQNENNKQRIYELFTELKTIIHDCVLDVEKRERAISVMETLQTCLPENVSSLLSNANNSDVPPQSIVRQRTFDIELQASLDKEAQSKPIHDEKEAPIFKQPINLMPNTVVVQDGDILQDAELNVIVKQAMLSLKNTVKSDANNEYDQRSADNNAPTVIVVMNPPTVPTRMPANESFRGDSVCDISLEKTLNNQPRTDVVRRRSMSLSLHDKLKQSTQTTIQSRRTEVKLPQSLSKDALNVTELKTPRRKSFSSNILTQKATTSNKDDKLKHIYKKGGEKLTIDLSKNMNELKPKHLRNTLAGGSITSSTGSLKATLPMKKVTPLLKTPAPSTDRTSAHFNTLSVFNNQCAQKQYIFARGSVRTQNESSYPNACSTPTVKRLSYAGQTDVGLHKTKTTNAATNNPRQTLTKPKTPLKARYFNN